MQNRSIIFLYKYVSVVLLALLLMQIAKQLKPSVINKTYNIDILNIQEDIIDSLAVTMNEDNKIDLLLGNNLFYIDTLDYNMIADSLFFYDYMKFKLSNIRQQNKLFYAYCPACSNYDNMEDSSFFNFQIKRYRAINKIAKQNNVFVGWFYPEKINKQLQNIVDTIHKNNVGQYHFLKSENIFHIFEKKSAENFDFEALKVVQNSTNKDMNKAIIDFLNSDFQILLTKRNEQNKAKKIISGLIKKYPLYQKLFEKKLRKILKYIYYQQNKADTILKTDNDNARLYEYLLNEKSIFIIKKNMQMQLPLQTGNFYSIFDLTDSISSAFFNIFKEYADYKITKRNRNIKKQLKKRNRNIILLDNNTFIHFGKDSLNKLLKLFPKNKSIIINFANFDLSASLTDSINLVQMPRQSGINDSLAAQVLFGGLAISGQVPRTLNKQIIFGNSINLSATRLGYSAPERVKISSQKLNNQIKNIVTEAIQNNAFPGCQILIAKKGKVIYNQSFGYYTYQKRRKVKNTDLYDLASLTKISASTIAAMKMLNDNKLKLNDPLGKFFKNTKIDYNKILPDTILKRDTFYISNIKNIDNLIKNKDTIRIDSLHFVLIDTIIRKLTPKNNIFGVALIDLLKHKSGISPTLPIYKYVYYRNIYFKKLIAAHKNFQKQLALLLRLPNIEIPDTVLRQVHLPDSINRILNTELKNIYYTYFSKIKTDSSTIQICENLYLRNSYFDTIWIDTKQLPVSNKKYFQYSDINMILLQMAIDSLNGMSIDSYLKKEIYKPLGLNSISYLPLNYYDKNRIVPTENDRQWRYCQLQGYVHDPSAAILGGIAGNAGLFANAHDLGILFQMILNGGSYGGKQFIRSDIIKQFTKRQEDTERGLGFDMPNSHAIIGSLAPESTFGHSGYTGTCIWIDPENELIYVFLSNRVYPSAKNWKIISMHIREGIHDAIYEAME